MTQDELLKKTQTKEIKGDVDTIAEIGEAINKAPEDDTPYIVATNNKQYVVGDITKTDKQEREYTLKFRLPEDLAKKYGVKEPKKIGTVVELTFGEGLINPISEMRIKNSLIQLMPYFKKFEEQEIKDLSEQELLERYFSMTEEYMVACATAAQGIFNVDDEIASYMLIPSAMNALLEFVENNPEYVNGSDFI